MGKRGSVLLHVLMTGALIALISATLLRLAVMRYTVTARATKTTRERRYDEAALAMLVSTWNNGNVYCANAGYYSCSGGGAGYAAPLTSCACTCTTGQQYYPPTITGSGSPPTCKLDVVSQDLQ
jgi:hypothetical protein